MSAVPDSGFAPWLAAPAPAPDWLEARRAQARARVQDLGLPTSREENWRYTSLTRLLAQGFVPAAEPDTAVSPRDLEALLIPGLESHRVVLVNGRFVPGLSRLRDLPAGVRVAGLAAVLKSDPDALKDRLDALTGAAPPFFAALNTAGLDDGLVVLLERGARLDRPLEVIHLSVGLSVGLAGGTDAPRVAQPRFVIALADGAQASLIERYLSLGDALSCTNAVAEITLGRDAVLNHQRIQTESATAFHLSGRYLSLGTASRYQGIDVGLGASWARTDLWARFAGEHAECDLQGLYLAGERQLMDFHLDVDHRLPHCTSRENYKGILYGKGRAVFDGRVLVARDAQKTDAAMSNRNLLLCEGAEVDTKPQLVINADDVKCSHGTTVGQIDPEQLFYLRSRGIHPALARRLLCLGFAGEILDALSPEPLREQVAEEVGRRLEQAPLG